MMRSMYAGVSGLRTHQSKMDVIGNNIANVNTIGFKKGQMTFKEVFNQTLRGASAPQDGRGGTNPQQVGLGVSVGSISTIHTQGSMQPTDNPTDLMIDGEGFFVVSDDTSFENRYYTRAGNFSLDRDGNLVTSDGYKVLGYKPDGEDKEKMSSEVAGIQINRSETVAPTATSKINFRGNLDSRVEEGGEGHKADTVIKDSLGNSYTVTFKFVKDETTTWTMSVDRITNQATGDYVEAGNYLNLGDNNDSNGDDSNSNSVKITFNSDGKLVKVGENGQVGEEISIAEVYLNLDGLEFKEGKDGGEVKNPFPAGTFGKIGEEGKQLIQLFHPDDEATIIKNLTQYANDMDAKPYAQDGNSSGKIEGFSIDEKGVVTGVFTNGERKALGQIMLAKFDNPMGLEKIGNNFYVDTRNSGEPQFGKGGSSGYGEVGASTLEMSNVDLSMEFTEMITTQRGFQANSRIITTSDEMLQELVNIKR